MKLAVIGGGNTGCCLAALLKLKGHHVILYEEASYWHEHIVGIMQNGGIIRLSSPEINSETKIDLITDKLDVAVHEAEIVFISVVLWRHQNLCDKLSKLLHEGQTVVFSAGNFASIRLRNILGKHSSIVTGEMSGNIFPCRMTSQTEAVIAAKLNSKLVAAYPASDTNKLIDVLKTVLPCHAAKNVFEASLNAPNLVVHLAGSLLNIAAIEKNPNFRLYSEGLTPSVLKCILAVEQEKEHIMKKMGYDIVLHSDFIAKLMQYDRFPEFDVFRSLAGPDSRMHRYINEDAAGGDCLILSLGKRIGVELPVIKALVTIASAINDRDYIHEGITMDKLGIIGETADEINHYLYLGGALKE